MARPGRGALQLVAEISFGTPFAARNRLICAWSSLSIIVAASPRIRKAAEASPIVAASPRVQTAEGPSRRGGMALVGMG
jgi:hypothetical protein